MADTYATVCESCSAKFMATVSWGVLCPECLKQRKMLAWESKVHMNDDRPPLWTFDDCLDIIAELFGEPIIELHPVPRRTRL